MFNSPSWSTSPTRHMGTFSSCLQGGATPSSSCVADFRRWGLTFFRSTVRSRDMLPCPARASDHHHFLTEAWIIMNEHRSKMIGSQIAVLAACICAVLAAPRVVPALRISEPAVDAAVPCYNMTHHINCNTGVRSCMRRFAFRSLK